MTERSLPSMEAAVSDLLRRLAREQLMEQVVDVRTEITGDTVVIRIRNLPPPSEKYLSRADAGRRLIKELKEKLLDRYRSSLEEMIKNITGADVSHLRSHYDPETAERVEIFAIKHPSIPGSGNLPDR